MAKDKYDKTLYRLIQTLTKISNNERPTTKELSEEFGVTIRTIQKDVYQTLSSFPIVKDESGKLTFYEGFTLRKTFLDDDELIVLNLALSQFNDVAEIENVKNRIFQKLMKANLKNPYFIKQADIEDINIDSPKIERLEKLIKESAIAKLELKHKTTDVELYKIANYDGFWYLFGKDLDDLKIKTFKLSDIQNVTHKEQYHKVSEATINSILEKTHSAFYSHGDSFKVTVKVYPEVAPYFLSKDFLESQEILEENEDGSLIVSFEVSHDEDVDNVIKAWLPHIEVLEPQRFREKLIHELKRYIEKVDR